MWQFSTRDTTTTIAYADDNMLLVLADGYLHRGRLHTVRVRMDSLMSINDGLDRVAEELANDVLEMT
jgi:hypothetical protein